MTLLPSTVTENMPTGTEVGQLSTADGDTADTFTYTIVGAAGGFAVASNKIVTTQSFNYEAMLPTPSVTISVQSTDSGNPMKSVASSITISVVNANDVPTAVIFSGTTSLTETTMAGALGTLSTTDEDSAQSHTYSLTGQSVAGLFSLSGNTISLVSSPNFEATGASATVTILSTDSDSATISQVITFSIANVNEQPSAITLTPVTVPLPENSSSGTIVGTLSTTLESKQD